MRVKLVLLPPFASTKLILPIPEEVGIISKLKTHIINSLSAVAQHASKGKDLVLEIDGFELLTGSAVDIIEKDDVVSVRLAPGSSKTALAVAEGTRDRKKRKASTKLGKTKEVKSHKRRRVTETATATSQKASVAPKASEKKQSIKKAQDASPAHPVQLPVQALAATKRNRSSSNSSSSSSSSASSASSSSSAESSSSASSSSSSSSSSSGSSSASSTSSSSAASSPEPAPSSAPKRQQNPSNPFPILNPNTSSDAAHVPPGQGKTATQNRNARRRLARQYKKQAAERASTSSPITPQPSVNKSGGTAIGGSEDSTVIGGNGFLGGGHEQGQDKRSSESIVEGTTSYTTPELPLPVGMSNRNKKRGFLEEMKARKGTKTVFPHDNEPNTTEGGRQVPGSSGGVDSQSTLEGASRVDPGPASGITTETALPFADGLPYDDSVISSTPRKSQSWGRERVVPPSETDLPSNIFVSSMEFPRAASSPKRRQKRLPVHPIDADEEEAVRQEDGGLEKEEEEMNKAPDLWKEVEDGTIWDRVESLYETLPILSEGDVSELKVGSILACKELELDMTTFTPELKLKLARITHAGAGAGVKLERLRPPVPVSEYEEEGYEEPLPDEEEEGEKALSALEVLGGKWRVV